MRKLGFVVAIAAALSFTVSAKAADFSMPLPLSPLMSAPVRAVNWTGFYVGGHVGYSISQELGKTSSAVGTHAIPAGNAWIGGLQLGMNYQFARWVAGLETDISWGGTSGSRMDPLCSPPFCFPPIRILTEASIDWQGTTRARLGYLVTDRMLVYGTAGIAYGSIATSMRIQCSLCNFPVNTRGLGAGWAAGAGIEWAFLPSMPNVTAKFEYMHIAIEGPNTTFPGGWIRPNIDQDIVRVGLNYRF